MSDLFHQLAARTLGLLPSLQPQIHSLYALERVGDDLGISPSFTESDPPLVARDRSGLEMTRFPHHLSSSLRSPEPNGDIDRRSEPNSIPQSYTGEINSESLDRQQLQPAIDERSIDNSTRSPDRIEIEPIVDRHHQSEVEITRSTSKSPDLQPISPAIERSIGDNSTTPIELTIPCSYEDEVDRNLKISPDRPEVLKDKKNQ